MRGGTGNLDAGRDPVDGRYRALGAARVFHHDRNLSVSAARILLAQPDEFFGNVQQSSKERYWIGAEIEQRSARKRRIEYPVIVGEVFTVVGLDRLNLTECSCR